MALPAALLCLALTACSTKKNTSATRFYHAQSARFNTLFNGQVAYTAGRQAQEKGHQDDYTRLLPITIEKNAATAKLGTSSYETAITKSEKAIKLHSIKARPKYKTGKKLSPKQKEYRNRKEFNPYLWRAWLMMGKAQFAEGEFIEASSTFNYVARLYETQPEVRSVALAWLARCYVALSWAYDAEDVLNRMRHETVTSAGERERQATAAEYYILTGQYEQALPELAQTIRHTRSRLQKARLRFLQGQLYTSVGDCAAAFKAYKRVVKSNPPYELAFNARIAQTEVAAKGQAKKMVKKLTRMTRNDNNKDYLDQIYYAIGNIQLSEGDSIRASWAWETGAEKSTRNGPAKATVLLRLSQLYWDMKRYVDAARTYRECIAILDKEHEEYQEAERRSKALDEAEPHLAAVKLQDSLQALAKLPETERLAAIDRVIAELKKKEKEQAKEEALKAAIAENQAARQATQAAVAAATTPGAKGAWYFYNPQTSASGKQDFQRKWGKRANEDNWRVSDLPAGEGTESDEELAGEGELADSIEDTSQEEYDEQEQARLDSLRNDPHEREYYLAQIPLTEEGLELSNALLSDGLYHGGVTVMERIQDFPYAAGLLLRLLRDFPDYDSSALPDVYYHLFLLYGRLGDDEASERYRQLLVSSYPDNRLALMLSNPDYELIARNGKHLEDSIYAATYDAYKEDRYSEVARNYEWHTRDFPEGRHRARIMFIQAMSLLYTHQRAEFLELLKEIVDKYGKEEIAEIAASFVKGISEGRLLTDSKYDSSDIWKRRTLRAEGGDSIESDTLSATRYSTFNFVLAYPKGSLDEDQLLYELANYNFTSFMVRNFEIEILDDKEVSMMCVKGFLSYDEVHAYAQRLYSDPYMATRLEGIRTLLISEDNLQLIGVAFSFDDYRDFYQEEFAPLDVPDDLRLDEPEDMEIRNYDDDLPETRRPDEEEEEEDDFPYGF